VTQILADAGYYAGLEYVNPDVLERSSRVGHLVHEQIHLFHSGRAPLRTGDRDLDRYLEGYEGALGLLSIEVHATEVLMGNARFAGTLDLYCRLGGEWAIGDVKTTAVLNKKALELQTAGYSILAEERYGKRITQRFGIHLTGAGGPWSFNFQRCDSPTARYEFRKLMVRHGRVDP
jgi:hypothetical protein